MPTLRTAMNYNYYDELQPNALFYQVKELQLQTQEHSSKTRPSINYFNSYQQKLMFLEGFAALNLREQTQLFASKG
jgi:hypothetical protein